MSSRRYPVAETYEERERDFYSRSNGRRSARDYEELDVDITRRSDSDFLRDDYGRNTTQAGALVVSDRRERDFDTRSRRSSPPRTRAREVEKEEIIIRDDHRHERAPIRRRHRSVSRDRVSFHRSEPDLTRPRTRDVEKEEIDINIRREEDGRSVRSYRPRETERDEVTIRRSEIEKPAPPRPREIERDEFVIRRGQGERRPLRRDAKESEEIDINIRREESRHRPVRPAPPSILKRTGESEEIDIDISRTERSGRGRVRSRSRERITIREQSRGPPPRERSLPPSLVARETEEFVIRRRRPSPSPSPPPQPRRETETITIRRTERSPTPPPPPPPPEPELPPPPVLAPIIRPPIHQEIHQEIITHHRHIDHGVERARSPTPTPPPIREPTPPPIREKTESLEIDIHRQSKSGGRYHDDRLEIDIDRRSRSRSRTRARSLSVARPRSLDPPRRRYYDDEIEAEAEYYNRKALERSYPGEAYNGATKDWAIVDVPPGTERVRMDGAGGGSQEISWQRYNGVRRSKFITGDREYDTAFGERAPPERRSDPVIPNRRPSDMWTEITKDLVIKEAIEHMGYDYEETEYFFYVMEYLKYEDVLQLVEVSDDIGRARRRRIREIEWEREDLHSRRALDDRGYYEREREVVIDRRERRY